jgi:hypothetical protein
MTSPHYKNFIIYSSLFITISHLLTACASTPCQQAAELNATCALPTPEAPVDHVSSCQGTSEIAASCALKHPKAYCAFNEAPHEATPQQNDYLRCVTQTLEPKASR